MMVCQSSTLSVGCLRASVNEGLSIKRSVCGLSEGVC